ncbi:Fur family transcriptional regulator [Nibricoccus sp. IMCC34717]|uniref:Fur family transcriptional regulator n=1 Tax=Nibricoccus sp. IMCC34717 TaxID=3034021 RepID=UPI00384C1F86
MIASTQTNHPLAAFTPSAAKPAALDAACERLREAGLRITQPRIAILNALIQRKAPASIDQLHSDLNQSSCDLVTVYRCLSAFQKAGLVRLSYFHNGTSLYELSLDREAPRYHVVDKDTHASEPIDAALAEELASVVRRIETELKNQGYAQVHTVVNFIGSKGSPAPTDAAPMRDASPAIPQL